MALEPFICVQQLVRGIETSINKNYINQIIYRFNFSFILLPNWQ